MKRFRLVTEQYGRAPSRHVSSVILSEDEAYLSLETEREMHLMTGWTVQRSFRDLTDGKIFCIRNKNVRIISIQSFDPMNDHLSTE